MSVGGAGLMFFIMMTVFFAWTRESRADGGLGWLEVARRTNFATVVGTHAEASVSSDQPPRQAVASRAENVDDDEHLAAYNAYLARLNQQHER
jgi:hypothetical protein